MCSEDIHLTRATNGIPSEPAFYHDFFERGIDPDVDDPTKCHDHSELPVSWPTLEDILGYRETVKNRIIALYNDPKAMNNRTIMRALWVGFEHEGEQRNSHVLILSLQSYRPPSRDILVLDPTKPIRLAPTWINARL